MIRIVFADEHEMFRLGITKLLEETREVAIRVVGHAKSTDEVLPILATTPADVLLQDIDMPGMSVFELMPKVRAKFPSVRILMLTMFDEPVLGVRAVQAGASGYLTKGRSAEDLINAVTTVASGGEFLGTETRKQREALEHQRPSRRADRVPYDRLSNREREVMRMIGEGRSISEIAVRFGRSPKTISTFRKRLLLKMGFAGDADLIRFVEDQKRQPGKL
jgi:two-component system, NarL family, invasion response regulator UvrY